MHGSATSYAAQPLDVAVGVLGHEHLQIVLDLDRSFAREEVKRAVEGAVAAFPVLGCRYVPGAWRDRWVPDPRMTAADAVQELDPAAGIEAATREWLAREFDEREGWPWRVALLPRDGGCRLMVSVLHAVTDGAGALAAVRELGRLLAGGAPVERPCPLERNVGILFRRLGAAGWFRLGAGLLREALRPLELPFLARTARPGRRRGCGGLAHGAGRGGRGDAAARLVPLPERDGQRSARGGAGRAGPTGQCAGPRRVLLHRGSAAAGRRRAAGRESQRRHLGRPAPLVRRLASRGAGGGRSAHLAPQRGGDRPGGDPVQPAADPLHPARLGAAAHPPGVPAVDPPAGNAGAAGHEHRAARPVADVVRRQGAGRDLRRPSVRPLPRS